MVVEISPLAKESEGRDPRGDTSDALATRFWRLWRDAMRFRLEELGVAVLKWDGDAPLMAVVEEVTAFRRYARHASV